MNKKTDISLRTIAALLGGYGISALASYYFTFAIYHISDTSKGVAVLGGSMLSYVVFFSIFITSFAITNTLKWCLALFAMGVAGLACLPLVTAI